ncbi:MAG: cation transporter [Patescibacteria group bacterium]
MSHQHTDVPLRVLGWCALLQLIGTAVGFSGSYFSHSLTVLSDALHWLADVLPATVTLIARAVIQQQRRLGHGQYFHQTVTGSGLFNAGLMIVTGVIAVTVATPAVSRGERLVDFRLALAVTIIGFAANWAGHALTHRYSRVQCEHDTRFDISSLSGHLLIDTVGSGLAVAFILLNAVYRTSVFDTVGGIFLGWCMVGYGLWLMVVLHLRRHNA